MRRKRERALPVLSPSFVSACRTLTHSEHLPFYCAGGFLDSTSAEVIRRNSYPWCETRALMGRESNRVEMRGGPPPSFRTVHPPPPLLSQCPHPNQTRPYPRIREEGMVDLIWIRVTPPAGCTLKLRITHAGFLMNDSRPPLQMWRDTLVERIPLEVDDTSALF